MTGSSTSAALPRLRDDLKIEAGAPLASGAPSWTIYDPVRHKFFQIGQRAIEMISCWSSGTYDALRSRLSQERGLELGMAEIEGFVSFLEVNQLIAGGEKGVSRKFARRSPISRVGGVLRQHIFFKVPLVRPQTFLEATLPLVRPLFSQGFVVFSALSLLGGLYLASRLWSEVLEHAGALFSPSGIAIYVLAIIFVKVLHELGHAYQAVMRGLSIPVMGLAFLVFIPLLYTDVTEAWRLKKRRDRVMVDAGGILAELALAAHATLIWCFLPDGALRTAVFAIATTSWVLSLLINLNPFLRFDGYYLLSDAVGFPNLQTRGFRYGRWALRRLLFGLDEQAPEALSRRRATFAIMYSYTTWIYRFVLFLGIALFVYSFVFKALGVFLLVAEVYFLILRPILSEIRQWAGMADRIVRSPRSWVSFALIAGLLVLLFWPMQVRVTVPAILEHQNQQLVFPLASAQLTQARFVEGETVLAGDTLAVFEDPELAIRIGMEEMRIAMLQARLLSGAGDIEERLEAEVIRRRLDETIDRLEAFRHLRESLVLTAPIGGRVTEVSRLVREGNWIDRREPLFRIVGDGGLSVRGLVEETNLSRIDTESRAFFVPENLELDPVEVTRPRISEVAVARLPDGYFAAPNGGPIAVSMTDPNGNFPQGMWYPVYADLAYDEQETEKTEKAVRGQLVFESKPETFASRIALRVGRILVRELSF